MVVQDDAAISAAEDEGDDELLVRLRKWWQKDREHSAEWRQKAKEDYAFVSGEQWTEEERQYLREQMRPEIVFNRIAAVVNSVSGSEITNRQEVKYLQREIGDAAASDIATEAARWFRDECDAEDEESDAFLDTVICGMGWTETRLDYESGNPDGDPVIERIDPLEMWWDCHARKRNLADARRVWRVRRIPLSEARDMFPGIDDAKLHAGWAHVDGHEGDTHVTDPTDSYGDDEPDAVLRDDDLVTIMQVQWIEKEPFWRVADPMTGAEVEMTEEEYRMASDRFAQISPGAQLMGVRQFRPVRKQAFVGAEVLEVTNTPCPESFSFQCITGYRDRNKGTWYGLVRGMKDPQRWANKWLSQSLHIMNSSAKGGIIVEKDITDDIRQFEESWARSEAVTVVKPGKLSGPNPGWMPKPQTQFPVGFFQLMEFAISSVRDVTGVNLEILGMREADQPASLEYQRRQAGMAILATFFDSLRRYRKRQGRCMLYLIQHYLNDGRLIRIMGQGNAQFVPLLLKADAKYDIIVDEAPSSPNQKELVWQMVGPMYMGLDPQLQMLFADFLPLPESIVQQIKAGLQQVIQSQQQAGQAQQKVEQAKAQAEIADRQASAQRDIAGAQKDMAEARKTEVETARLMARPAVMPTARPPLGS